jgi:hypothetical protein
MFERSWRCSVFHQHKLQPFVPYSQYFFIGGIWLKNPVWRCRDLKPLCRSTSCKDARSQDCTVSIGVFIVIHGSRMCFLVVSVSVWFQRSEKRWEGFCIYGEKLRCSFSCLHCVPADAEVVAQRNLLVEKARLLARNSMEFCQAQQPTEWMGFVLCPARREWDIATMQTVGQLARRPAKPDSGCITPAHAHILFYNLHKNGFLMVSLSLSLYIIYIYIWSRSPVP